MTKQRIVYSVEELAKPIINQHGMELVDLELVKEGGRWILRFYIDKSGGVGIEDCKLISEKMDILLDEKNYINYPYTLEVSSPGIERPLKKADDFERFAGKLVKISTYGAIGGKKKFTGRLLGIRDNSIAIDINGETILIPFEQVASARLHWEF